MGRMRRWGKMRCWIFPGNRSEQRVDFSKEVFSKFRQMEIDHFEK